VRVVYLLRNPGIETRTPEGWTGAVAGARPDGTYSDDDLALIADADALVVGLEPVGEEILARAPRLKLVQRLGVGYSNVDLEAAARHGVPVCYMPDFNAATVAEHTMMLILALLRRVFESTLLMKGGQWPLGTVVGAGIHDLRGRTLGLIGFGAIGRAVAQRARPFEVRILYHEREASGDEEAGAEPATLDALLAESDVVSIHVPLTAETRGLLSRERLERMKRSAILVNTARGAVIDEGALAELLSEGRIAGAGIDVFADEPPDPRHPLRRSPNVLLTPHVAGQTREAMERMVASMVENLNRIARGREPLYLVPPP
jgi:phosphoglycerate dehydrogenase-like enzyme